MIQHYYVEQLERDLEAMKKDRDGLKAALLAQVKQQSGSVRDWAKESAALKIRVGMLERDNAELRKLLREAITSLARHRAALAKEAKP